MKTIITKTGNVRRIAFLAALALAGSVPGYLHVRSKCHLKRWEINMFAKLLMVGALGGAALFAAPAGAQTFDFSFVAGNVSGSGMFTTTGTSSPFLVTGATGSITDTDISASPLAITGLSGYAGADNELFFPGPPFTDVGISMVTAASDFNLQQSLNIVLVSFFNPPGDPLFPTPGGVYSLASFDVTAAPTVTPLPAALPLFATGLGALGLLGWRRKRKACVSLLGVA
jgi:hypothetical protein